MIKKNSKYTAEQLVNAWNLVQNEGKTYREAADLSGIAPSSIYMVMKDLQRYVSGARQIQANTSDSWREAVEQLRRPNTESTEVSDQETDRSSVVQVSLETASAPARAEEISDEIFDKLDAAFQTFQNAIADFVKSEIHRGTVTEIEQLKREHEEELTALRNQYEAEFSKLKENVRNSSFTSKLRRKLVG